MLILVRQIKTGEYFTIYRRDKAKFLSLAKFCEPEPFNFELIEDRSEIRKILEEEFTSKGRGEEYDTNSTSVTRIAYSLYPMDVYSEKFLIRWFNNQILDPEAQKETELTLSKGTWCHKICELWILDQEARKQDKPLIKAIEVLKQSKKPSIKLTNQITSYIQDYIKKYINQAYQDPEIISKIPNLKELKPYLENLSLTVLPKFIYEELINVDLVYSEIFLSIPNYIQGSIDLVCYKDGKFTIIDYKTTSSVDKKTGKPKFKNNSQLEPYSRQLAIYNLLLQRCGMTHLQDGELPDFYIYQIHLIGNSYKKLTIPKEMVQQSTKKVERILDWYWATRRGETYDPDIPENDVESLEFLTL